MEKGCSREEVDNMTFEYANHIMFPERDEHHQPAFLSKLKGDKQASGKVDGLEVMRYKLWVAGWPKHAIEDTLAEKKRRQQEMMAAIHKRELPKEGQHGDSGGRLDRVTVEAGVDGPADREPEQGR
jgi:hypothetical protein